MAAIYQWFIADVQTFTTTPYPIEAVEAIEISCDLGDCYMQSFPEDSGDMGLLFLGAEMSVIRIDLPEVQDSGDMGLLFIGAEMKALRIDMPEQSDSGDMALDFIGAEMTARRIEALVPEQALDISCTIDPSTCYMTDAP